jgi:hypothetical protein
VASAFNTTLIDVANPHGDLMDALAILANPFPYQGLMWNNLEDDPQGHSLYQDPKLPLVLNYILDDPKSGYND